MDEETVIKDVLSGHTDAYEQLVARYHVGLIIRCEQIVGNRADAEDIAQTAFIKAYQQLATFDSAKARFSTWLYTIAIRQAIDHQRKHGAHVAEEYSEQHDPGTTPDYAASEQIQLVRQAVARLEPPSHRQAVEAYYWQGKSYQQIADQQHVPINTVRTWLHRAKQQLKEELA